MDAFDYEAALQACARRDANALRRVYEREAGLLLGIALRIVRRRDLAADAVHDAFVDIWQRASTFDPARGGGRAWIVSVVRHRAIRAARRAGRETGLEAGALDGIADDNQDPYAALATSEEGAALHRCLAELPDERRRVVLLAYVDGLSQTEIADRLGSPLGTVKAWTRRALIFLKGCLS